MEKVGVWREKEREKERQHECGVVNLFLILCKSFLEFLERRQQVNDICCRRRERIRIRLTTAKKRERNGIKNMLTTQCSCFYCQNLILTLCDSDLWSGEQDVSLGT